MNTLRRYKRHYKIPARPGLNKAQLVDVSTKPLRHYTSVGRICMKNKAVSG